MEKTDKRFTGYHRPVCKKCNCELRPETNGVGVLDMAKFGPCDLWDADLWKCPKCGIEVVGGFGNSPISGHWEEPRFKKMIAGYGPLLIKNTG